MISGKCTTSETEDDINQIFGPGGAIEAFVEAKEKGLTTFIGVTGHHDPAMLGRCFEMFDFDTVLLPVNPGEPTYSSFIDRVIPDARARGMGIVGMKAYFRGFAAKLPWYDSMEPFLHFALSRDITTAVVGCDSVAQLEENVRFAESYSLMSEADQRDLIRRVQPYARSLMYYKP